LKPLCLLFAVTNRGFIFSPQEATAQWALQARLAAVKAFYGAGGDQQRAVAAFDSSWNAQYRETDAMHIRGVRQFISYNVHKLESTYTLLTQPSPGRPHLIPDEEVRRAAGILASGHWVQTSMEVDGRELEYLHWCRYTSIKEAIMHDQYLGALCNQYAVGADYLRRRLHEVDPQLQYGPLPMKDVLSDSVKKQRMDYATDMLFRLKGQPNFLKHVYFMDECRIWVGRNLQGKVMVWSHRGDFDGEPPIPNELLGHHKGFKINLLLVVNALRGVVWVEFLSGTEGMADDERHNPQMIEVMRQRNGQPYKVSHLNMMHFTGE
jgi:hypothetical protein